MIQTNYPNPTLSAAATPVRPVLPRPENKLWARRKSPTKIETQLGSSSVMPLKVFDQRKSLKII